MKATVNKTWESPGPAYRLNSCPVNILLHHAQHFYTLVQFVQQKHSPLFYGDSEKGHKSCLHFSYHRILSQLQPMTVLFLREKFILRFHYTIYIHLLLCYGDLSVQQLA